MRLPDWDMRLHAFLSDMADKPFIWGLNDCALFACAAGEAITGVDKAAAFRGVYSDRLGAAKALRTIGKGTLFATLDSLFRPKSLGHVMRGDIVAVGSAVGVCVGYQAAFVGEEGSREGLIMLPRREWVRGWAVD